MIKFLNRVVVPILFVLVGYQTFGQTNEERRERADKFFEKEKYVDATSDYLHLLSLEPRNADLNFRYGACLLYNSNRKSEAIRYLKYATTDPNVDPRAWYFYGLSLHLNYQFDDAQKSYGTYANLTLGKEDKRYPVDRQIEMCSNGKRLMTTFTDIIVAEKQEIDNQKFFRIYTDANTIGGEILVTAKFQSKLDQKMGHIPVVHFPPNATAIYYSSYGDNLDSGLDIYVRRKLPNGEWGDPQLLPGAVNTKYDEDFPYMHPSGKYLYFSSTGHNSMGGYDIYLSKFDPNTNSFREPENVDFAISSPDDDFFYVVDSAFQNAYFASARQSQDGMLHVYKVKVARVPLKEVIIMGEFISEVDPEMKSMEINLTYHSNGKDVGLVRSNKVGKYSYVFPQGGKYNYNITVEGLSDEYKFVVDLPFLDELRPLKQQIIHTKEDGKDVLKILNLFDEDVEGAEAIIAEVIRKKAELDVNIGQFDVNELEAEQRNKEILSDLGFANMSPAEISQKLEELVKVNLEKEGIVEQVSDNLNSEILAKAERVSDLDEIQAELNEKAEKTDDPVTKHRLLTEAQQKEAEKQNLLLATQALIDLKEDVNQQLKTTEDSGQIQRLKNLQSNYDKLIEQDDVNAAIQLLSENKGVIRLASTGTPDDMLTSYVNRATELRKMIREERDKDQQFNLQIDNANQEINRLQGLIEVSKKKDIPILERQIEDKREEIGMLKADQLKSREKKSEYARELSKIEEQIASLQNALSTEDHVAVNQTKLNESIKKVEEIEQKEPEINYQEEIARIEEASPALFNSQASAEEKIRTDLLQDRKEIQKDKNLSESEKLAREEELIRDAITEVETRNTIVQNELKTNPSDELKQEAEELAAYKEQLNTELNSVETKLDSLKTENPDIAYSKSDLQKEIDPTLEQDLKKIAGSSGDDLQKAEQTRERLERLESAVKLERSKVQEQLKIDPENGELQARAEMLEEITSDAKTRLDKAREQENELIAANEIVPANAEDILPGIDQHLTNARSNPDKKESLTQEKELLQELLATSNEKAKQLDKDLKKDPSNSSKQREKSALLMLVEETQKRTEEIDNELNSLEQIAETTTVTNEDLLPGIDGKLQAAKSDPDRKAGLTKEKELLQNLNNAASERLKEVDKKLKKDPSNATLQKERNAVEAIIAENESRIDAISTELNTVEQPTDVLALNQPETYLKSYTSERDNILNGNTDQVAATKNLIALDNRLLDRIEEKKNELEKQLNSDPDNETLKNQLAAIEQFENETKQRIHEEEGQLTQLSSTSEKQFATKEDVIAELLPEYTSQKEAIESNPNLSENEKDQRILALNNEVLDKADALVESLEARADRNPDDNGLKKSLEQVYQLMEELEAENGAIQNVASTNELANELVKNYTKRKEEAGKIKDLNKRTDALVAVENELKAAINSALSEVETELASDPNNSEALVRKRDLLKLESENAQHLNELQPLKNVVYQDENELRNAILGDQDLLNSMNTDPLALNESERKEQINQLKKALALIEENGAKLNTSEVDSELKSKNADWYNALAEEIKDRINLLENGSATTSFSTNDIVEQYDQKREQIEKNQSLNETEKLEAYNDLDQTVVANSDKLLKSLDKKLKKDPENVELNSERNAIQEERTAAESRISENEQVIAAMKSANPLETSDLAELKNKLLPGYETKRNEAIDSGDKDALLSLEYDLYQALLTEHEKTAGKTDAELQQLNTAVAQQKDQVEKLLVEKTNILSENELNAYRSEMMGAYDDRLSNAGSDAEKQIAVEQDLLDAIQQKREELEKKRAKKPSVSVDLELYKLDRLEKESKQRIEQIQSGEMASSPKESYLESLRSDAGVSVLNESELTTKSDLEEADKKLEAYEAILTDRLGEVNERLSESPTQELKEEQRWIQEEIANVQARRRKVRIAIGDLETEVVAESGEKAKLNQEINETKKKLDDPSTPESEKTQLREELAELNAQKAEIEVKEISATIKQDQQSLVEELNSASASSTEESVIPELKTLVEQQNEVANRELETINELNDPVQKAYELEKYREAQEQKQEDIRAIALNEQIRNVEAENNIQISNKEELETRKRRFVVRLGELTREIDAKKEEIADAKKKDVPGLTEEKEILESEYNLIKDEIARIDQQLTQLPEKQPDIVENALTTDLAYKEEREIASSKTYTEYQPVGKIAFDKAEQIRTLEEELEQARLQLGEQLLLANTNEADPDKTNLLIEEIKTLEVQIDKLKVELIQDEYRANQLLPSNEDEAMKMKNLVARGVKPIQVSALAVSLLNMPSTGFAIGEKAEPGAAREMPIAVGVEYPEGLVYRVQVGAFARPIPAELFSEFTPVSGEKIDGTNITRYMAGYFNDINKVVNAKDQIRNLGYSDAFIVAYCNGKRIKWGEARRLEQEGTCVPKGANELMMEVAQNTAQNLGIDLGKNVVEVEEHDYNKAPGAAEADAIEDMKGLFFTVQIGVFNRPVGEENLYGMKEILTFRLPNGQIRYASGVFDSVEDALPRRKEALASGVVGAFVTAYYNGERIPLYEARKILDEQGESVLQSRQPKEEKTEEKKNPVVEIKTEKVEKQKPVEEEMMMRVQVVTKKRFEEYPRDVLNRYNTEGTFFFDEEDGRVKSIIYADEYHLPRLYNFRKDIDTIYIDDTELPEAQYNTIEVNMEQMIKVPGDLMDWLLRVNYRKSIDQHINALTLRIYDVPEEKQQEILEMLRGMGYVPELVETEEMELNKR